MNKYRKKPVVVEAIQWTGNNIREVNKFYPKAEFEINIVNGISYSKVYIRTLEGVMSANPGDYIIKGVQGEFYPCKPDIFKQTYEKE